MSTSNTDGASKVPRGALHPAVAACALASVALVTMCSLHPVLAAVSLAGALLCSLAVRGAAPTVAGVRWQLPAVALVALANPLFTASGSTLVARVGPLAVYVESVAFGLVAGAVMVASLVWLECLAHVVPPAVLRSTLGRPAPTTALALSMTSRLVPQLLERYGTVAEAGRANTAARMPAPRGPLAAATTHSGTLLAWALEDSLVRADSMRARGWGGSAPRTSYLTWRLRLRDVAALAVVVPCALASALLAWVACAQWHFYPTMPHLVFWWGYAPFALLCAAPSAYVAWWRWHWRRVAERNVPPERHGHDAS